MIEVHTLAPAFLAGTALGLLSFVGLWLTVARLPKARNPVLLVWGSSLLRLSVVLAGFALVAQGRFAALLAALGGFVLGRFLVVRVTRNRRLRGATE